MICNGSVEIDMRCCFRENVNRWVTIKYRLYQVVGRQIGWIPVDFFNIMHCQIQSKRKSIWLQAVVTRSVFIDLWALRFISILPSKIICSADLGEGVTNLLTEKIYAKLVIIFYAPILLTLKSTKNYWIVLLIYKFILDALHTLYYPVLLIHKLSHDTLY